MFAARITTISVKLSPAPKSRSAWSAVESHWLEPFSVKCAGTEPDAATKVGEPFRVSPAPRPVRSATVALAVTFQSRTARPSRRGAPPLSDPLATPSVTPSIRTTR
jgi:hypothetical protein